MRSEDVEKTHKRTYAVGDRVEKRCAICQTERGHVVAAVGKLGQVSRVSCPICGARSSFKPTGQTTASRELSKGGALYDSRLTYRVGQMMTHAFFGAGEVTAVIEPHKIDVLFADRLRRLVHRKV